MGTGPLSPDIISERLKQVSETLFGRAVPKITEMDERLTHVQDYQTVLDMRMADNRIEIDKLKSTVYGNGSSPGLRVEIAEMSSESTHQAELLQQSIKNTEKSLSDQINELKNWKKSFDAKLWAILMVVISLLIETAYHLLTGKGGL